MTIYYTLLSLLPDGKHCVPDATSLLDKKYIDVPTENQSVNVSEFKLFCYTCEQICEMFKDVPTFQRTLVCEAKLDPTNTHRKNFYDVVISISNPVLVTEFVKSNKY